MDPSGHRKSWQIRPQTWLQDSLFYQVYTEHGEEALLGPSMLPHRDGLVAVLGELPLLGCLAAVDGDETWSESDVVVAAECKGKHTLRIVSCIIFCRIRCLRRAHRRRPRVS